MNLLGWDFDFFRKATLNLWLKQWIWWLKINNPDALKDDDNQTIHTLDQTPMY